MGTVDENGHHINLGDAGHSAEENMEILHGFEVVEEEESTVEVRKTVNPDGSYVEVITDHRNNRAEINEYDAQGNWVSSTHGTFSDEPEISDDDFDDYIAYLEEHENGDEAGFQRWKANRHNGKVIYPRLFRRRHRSCDGYIIYTLSEQPHPPFQKCLLKQEFLAQETKKDGVRQR